MELEKMFESCFELEENFSKLRSVLSTQLSEIDRKIVDIEHEIEFGKYDAVTMITVYKDLQDSLQKRRKIKTNLDKTFKICQVFNKFNNIKEESKKQRKYHPRILDLDFSNDKSLLTSRKIINAGG